MKKNITFMWEGGGDIYGFGRQLIIGDSVVFEMSMK